MQIHSLAADTFGKEQVEEFWRIVASINWPENQNALNIRADLLEQLSPRAAKITREICDFYMRALVQRLNDWRKATNDTKELSMLSVELAASNAVGGGQQNYDEYLKNPGFLTFEVNDVDTWDHFSYCIPAEDDYFVSNEISDLF